MVGVVVGNIRWKMKENQKMKVEGLRFAATDGNRKRMALKGM